MFRLRIHTVDMHLPEAGGTTFLRNPLLPSSTIQQQDEESSPSSTTRNPKVQENTGIVHLYRDRSHPPEHLPAGRSTLVFVLAVPNRMCTEDFLHFCGSYTNHFSHVQILRNDGVDDRHSVLINLDDQKSADSFYRNYNGRRFMSSESEVCHVLFTICAEYTDSIEIATTPPTGFTELPTCPVCLAEENDLFENASFLFAPLVDGRPRLDQDTSGILTTVCDHSFQCSCTSKWTDSSCPVCRFCQEHSEKPTCSVCGTSENLWICVICGFVGCGRYKEGHAVRHSEDTKHCFSLDLETQQVWDYDGDNYVHRLNQSKTNGKMVMCRSNDDNLGSCDYSDNSGISEALFSSKVEAIVDEYNHLLTSQLDTQRQYYESLLIEAKGKRVKSISEAVEKAVNSKLQDIQLRLEKCVKEKKIVADINETLVKNQDVLQKKAKEIEERGKAALRLRDEKIIDLEEQMRDLMIYVEAQKTLGNMTEADDIKGGTVLPVQVQQSSSTNSRRTTKTNRRRN